MSTIVSSGHPQALKSEADLAHYFEKYAKSKSQLKLGIEAELLGIHRQSGQALPYQGAFGIQSLLKFLAQKFNYTPILDLENIIGLTRKDMMISLEPGGQVELSAPPVSNLFEIEAQVQLFLKELRAAEEHFPEIRFLAAGIQPFSALDEISWVPKRRYKLMADYLKNHGTLSHHMMKRTATNQLNLDYTSEADAMAKFRTALGITSIVTAMFANSSFMEGKPNGYATYRLEIWNHTDPDRSGLLTAFTEPGKTFRDYLEYILQMPVFFIVRNGEWIPLQGTRFRDYLKNGFQGHKATMDDFELHLSTAFPEARFKQYLEVRGADCQSPDLIPAVAAFWKGILYDEKAREDAWALTSFANQEERMRLHLAVPREGLKASLAGRPILPIAEKLVTLSCEGLSRQQVPGLQNECIFLDRIREKILKPGKSPGETLLEKWDGEFARTPGKLIQYLGI